jgi:3-oxoacyl-ACP reductase-like protein
VRSWQLKALAALLTGLLAFTVAGTSGQAVADDAGSNAAGQSGAGSAAAASPAPAQSPSPKPRAAEPEQDPFEPTNTLLVFGGGLLVLALAAIGLTITFRSLLGDLRNRRNRYRRRAKREPRGA